ncbi:MAG: hypothetical protein BWY83_02673 [bacterium ADurb.Bin478]|nr:MAG: hypothetical protein BWY83_02673 [bacterium ADurb.Bin478]
MKKIAAAISIEQQGAGCIGQHGQQFHATLPDDLQRLNIEGRWVIFKLMIKRMISRRGDVKSRNALLDKIGVIRPEHAAAAIEFEFFTHRIVVAAHPRIQQVEKIVPAADADPAVAGADHIQIDVGDDLFSRDRGMKGEIAGAEQTLFLAAKAGKDDRPLEFFPLDHTGHLHHHRSA